jgi:hypothetical protein
MDKDLYKEKLSQVAEWQIPKLTDTDMKLAQKALRGRGRPTKEEQYQDEHQEIFLDLFNGINPTMAPELTRVKIQNTTCEDCGKTCEKGCRKEIKFYKATPGHVAHRRVHCKNCGFYQNPETGVFDIKQGPACQIFLNWAKHQFSVRNKLTKTPSDK